MEKKAKSIEMMEDSRVIFLCLFGKGKLLEAQQMNDYSLDGLSDVLGCAVEFSMNYYYPKRYVNELYRQLSELGSVVDYYSEARDAIIQETKQKINENIIPEEYMRSQLIFYIKSMLKDLQKETVLSVDILANATAICNEYIERINSITLKEDGDSRRKLYQINRLCSELRALCVDSESRYLCMWIHTDRLEKQATKSKKPDRFRFYKYYFKKYGIRGKVTESNVESKVSELMHYVANELDILKTHLSKGYLSNNPDRVEEFRSSDEYYKDLKRLIDENGELLLDNDFADNVAYMMHLDSDKKNSGKIKDIRKRYRKIKKEGK